MFPVEFLTDYLSHLFGYFRIICGQKSKLSKLPRRPALVKRSVIWLSAFSPAFLPHFLPHFLPYFPPHFSPIFSRIFHRISPAFLQHFLPHFSNPVSLYQFGTRIILQFSSFKTSLNNCSFFIAFWPAPRTRALSKPTCGSPDNSGLRLIQTNPDLTNAGEKREKCGRNAVENAGENAGKNAGENTGEMGHSMDKREKSVYLSEIEFSGLKPAKTSHNPI